MFHSRNARAGVVKRALERAEKLCRGKRKRCDDNFAASK
jgi:hypothetical protein